MGAKGSIGLFFLEFSVLIKIQHNLFSKKFYPILSHYKGDIYIIESHIYINRVVASGGPPEENPDYTLGLDCPLPE